MKFVFGKRRASGQEIQPQPPLVAGQFIRPCEPLAPADSLRKAIFQMRRQDVSGLPVVQGGVLVGWMTEERISEVLFELDGDAELVTVQESMQPAPAMVNPGEPLVSVIPLFHATGERMLPVDVNGHYLGCVARADLLAAHAKCLMPARLGGLATPLGVYLTTGAVSGGAGTLGLVLAGVVLAVLLWVTQALVAYGSYGLYHLTGHPFLRDLSRVLGNEPVMVASPVTEMALLFGAMLLTIMVFLLLLRFAPRMAGYHAAEHQTVNAVEAGEPLTIESVRRMPRVHARCGTNLWGILLLSYLGLMVMSMTLSTELGRENFSLVITVAVFSVIMVVMSWRRLGSAIQAFFTTRPATRAELESGIRAGREVLQRHLYNPHAPVTPLGRLWRMGFIQVAIGVIMTGSVLEQLEPVLDYLWHFLVK